MVAFSPLAAVYGYNNNTRVTATPVLACKSSHPTAIVRSSMSLDMRNDRGSEEPHIVATFASYHNLMSQLRPAGGWSDIDLLRVIKYPKTQPSPCLRSFTSSFSPFQSEVCGINFFHCLSPQILGWRYGAMLIGASGRWHKDQSARLLELLSLGHHGVSYPRG